MYLHNYMYLLVLNVHLFQPAALRKRVKKLNSPSIRKSLFDVQANGHADEPLELFSQFKSGWRLVVRLVSMQIE